jgi:hypothetical protein
VLITWKFNFQSWVILSKRKKIRPALKGALALFFMQLSMG